MYGAPAMSDDHDAITAALQRAIDRGDNVVLARDSPANPTWSGFPLALDGDLLLVRTVRDFDFDGFAVMLVRDVVEVRSGDAERFYREVLRAEARPGGTVRPEVPLHSLRAAIDAVRARHRFAIVECERLPAFYLGELVADEDVDSAAMHFIHVDGTRESAVTRIPLDDVTLVRFDERYVSLFGRHAVAEDHH